MALVSGESQFHVMCAGRGMCSVVLTGEMMQRLGSLASAASAGEVVVDEATASGLGEGWTMEKVHKKEAYRLLDTSLDGRFVAPHCPRISLPKQEHSMKEMLDFAPGCVSM